MSFNICVACEAPMACHDKNICSVQERTLTEAVVDGRLGLPLGEQRQRTHVQTVLDGILGVPGTKNKDDKPNTTVLMSAARFLDRYEPQGQYRDEVIQYLVELAAKHGR